MNDNSKGILKTIGLGFVLVLLTILYVWWGRYLNEHFAGTFDVYGLPSKFYRTGWFLLIDAWEIWVIPTLFLLIVGLGLEHWFRHVHTYSESFSKHRRVLEAMREKQIMELASQKAKNKMSFSHALELEALKQQVGILKGKYLEERQRSEQVVRDADEAIEKARKQVPSPVAIMPTPPSNAHNEAIISSLRAENKKHLKQIADLQDDLDQSNALIEKLLEGQGEE